MINLATLALVSIVFASGYSRAVVFDEPKNENYALVRMATIEGSDADRGYFMAKSRHPRYQRKSMQL